MAETNMLDTTQIITPDVTEEDIEEILYGPKYYRRGLEDYSEEKSLSVEQIADALFQAYGILADTARILRMDPRSVQQKIEISSELKIIKQNAREHLLDLAENRLVTKVRNGSFPAISFLLRTVGKERGYGENTKELGKIEVSVKLPEGIDASKL